MTQAPMAKKPVQVLFAKNVYTPPVKVQHWDFAAQAEVKDTDVYRDHLSNHRSTYWRLGTQDQPFTTETRVMLAQVYTKTDPVYAYRPLVNFTSYPCTDTPSRNKLMEKANLAQLPKNFGITEYTTTQQDDYRIPCPGVMKPLTMVSPPWLLNRLICSDLTQNYGSAPPPGDYQCLDTHTPLGHIRQMRLFRKKSFDPASGLQDFPVLHKSLDDRIDNKN